MKIVGGATILLQTFTSAIGATLEGGTGHQPAIMQRSMLPRDMTTDLSMAWIFTQEEGLPEGSAPLAGRQEMAIVSILTDKLLEKFGVRIGPLCLDRQVRPATATTKAAAASKILVVGCSNAKRLGKELMKQGAAVASISAAGWRPTATGIETLARLVREQIQNERPDFVVFHFLDNVL